MIPRRQILTDETYDSIMSLLMNHQVQPGERINIDALSRMLGVSVTPVRETLARLESEGLVTKQPLVGYTATPLLTLAQLSDMYEVRLALEPLAARQAALRSSQEQVDQIAATVGGRRASPRGTRSDEHLLVALDDERFQWERITGHRQLTDVYLLSLAVARDAQLVTFDRSIPWQAVAGAKASDLRILGAA